jgi:hypothetical protein
VDSHPARGGAGDLQGLRSALIALAVGVYVVHGAFTQTGVVGSLIYFEGTLIGSDDPLFSAFLAWVLLAVPAMVGWSMLSGMVNSARDTRATERLLFRGFVKGEADPHGVTTNRELLIVWGIVVGATWLIGYAVDLVETLAAEMERLGVANAAQIGIETLADRITSEVVRSSSVIVGRSEICTWCRVA